ncbi:MAG: hypothetical protein RLZZ11_372 [Cyanobacteriota bacterium]|jgi:hypothetical protein
MRRSLAIAAACLSLALVACSPVEKKKKHKEASEQQATVDVCEQLTKVGTALEASAALKPTSTVGDAEAAGKQLRTALKGLKQAEVTLEADRMAAFQKQAQAFNKELKKVSKEKQLTLEEAAKTLKPQADSVIAAHKQLKAAVQCNGAAAAPAQ